MDQKDLILKIKLLKQVQPRKEWKDSNRAFLLAKIEREFNNAKQFAPEAVKIREERVSSLIQDIQLPVHNFKTEEISDFQSVGTQNLASNLASIRNRLAAFFSLKVLFKPAFAMVLLFSVSCGALAMGIKSQDTIPGNFLYPVKMVIENTETYFTSNDKKSELHTNLATRRLDEAVKISKADETNSIKKEKIEKSIETFKQEIKIAEARMKEPTAKDEPEKAVEMAKNIETKTKEFEKVLKDIPEDLSDEIKEDIENTVEEALVVAEEASDSALEVMVENMNGISDEEMLAKITEKIEKTEEKIAVAEVKAEKIKKTNEENQEEETNDKSGAEDIKDEKIENEETVRTQNFVSEVFAFWEIKAVLAEEEEVVDDDSDSEVVGSEESIDKVIKDLGEAKALLEKAKEYLEEKDFKTALKLLSASKELVKKTEIAIEELPCEDEFQDEGNSEEANNEENPEYIEAEDEENEDSEGEVKGAEDENSEEELDEEDEDLEGENKE